MLSIHIKKIFLIVCLIFLIGCEQKESLQELTTKFSLDDLSSIGIKMKGDFETKFPEATEGELSSLRASLVKRQTLADVAREIDLAAHMRMGGGELKSGGFRRDSILSDALEAVFGAPEGGKMASGPESGMDFCALARFFLHQNLSLIHI